MQYEELAEISREEAEQELRTDDWEKISVALLRLALHDQDPVWLEAKLLPYLRHEHHWVRGIAATSLGHVARLHGVLNRSVVIPAIRRLLNDDSKDTRGNAEDALDDIEMLTKSD